MNIEEFGIKLYCGNSVNIMNSLPENSIDCVICDPPYKTTKRGNSDNYGGFFKKESAMNGNGGFNCNETPIEYFLKPLFRIMKDGSHGYIMINDVNLINYHLKIEEVGFSIFKTLIWKKNNVVANTYYMNQHEYIIFFRKGSAKIINNCSSKSVLEYNNPYNKVHPSQKPVSLLTRLVTNSSNENDTILDFAMGYGSTGIASYNNKRKFIGIDIDEYWFSKAKDRITERIEEDQRQLKLF
jgi:site-specific DNA-methyltransferase (adenine-specific)